MRIGLVSQSCDVRTGIGRIVNALAREFSETGCNVSCAAQFFEGLDTRVAKRRIPCLSSSGGINKLLFRLNGHPFSESEADIVHSFGVGKGAHVVSAQSCHLAGMKLLGTKRGQLLEGRSFGLYDRVSLADERFLLTSPSTRKVIAVSYRVKSQILEHYHLEAGRIAVIPNGVDIKAIERLRNRVNRINLRAELGYSDDEFVLLFVGNEFGRKGLTTLIKTLAALRDASIRLLVVGAGEIDPYARLATTLHIAGAVQFVGSVPEPERMFLAADVFVLPSLYEPFGMVVLEAMAAGIPVITSKSCGATEGMRHRRDVLLLQDPSSAEELAETIREVKQSESLRQTLSNAGGEAVREFSWTDIARQILAIYDDVTKA